MLHISNMHEPYRTHIEHAWNISNTYRTCMNHIEHISNMHGTYRTHIEHAWNISNISNMHGTYRTYRTCMEQVTHLPKPKYQL